MTSYIQAAQQDLPPGAGRREVSGHWGRSLYRERPLQGSLPPNLERAMEAGPHPSNHSPLLRPRRWRPGAGRHPPRQNRKHPSMQPMALQQLQSRPPTSCGDEPTGAQTWKSQPAVMQQEGPSWGASFQLCIHYKGSCCIPAGDTGNSAQPILGGGLRSEKSLLGEREF